LGQRRSDGAPLPHPGQVEAPGARRSSARDVGPSIGSSRDRSCRRSAARRASTSPLRRPRTQVPPAPRQVMCISRGGGSRAGPYPVRRGPDHRRRQAARKHSEGEIEREHRRHGQQPEDPRWPCALSTRDSWRITARPACAHRPRIARQQSPERMHPGHPTASRSERPPLAPSVRGVATGPVPRSAGSVYGNGIQIETWRRGVGAPSRHPSPCDHRELAEVPADTAPKIIKPKVSAPAVQGDSPHRTPAERLIELQPDSLDRSAHGGLSDRSAPASAVSRARSAPR